jgi:hypothetical protein
MSIAPVTREGWLAIELTGMDVARRFCRRISPRSDCGKTHQRQQVGDAAESRDHGTSLTGLRGELSR